MSLLLGMKWRICLLFLILFVCVRSEKRGNFSLCFCDRVLIIYSLRLSPGICSIFSPNDWYNVFVQFQSSKSIYLERLSCERDIQFCNLGLDSSSIKSISKTWQDELIELFIWITWVAPLSDSTWTDTQTIYIGQNIPRMKDPLSQHISKLK